VLPLPVYGNSCIRELNGPTGPYDILHCMYPLDSNLPYTVAALCAVSSSNADDVDMELLDNAESVCTILTPIRRITLPSPMLSARTLADVNFFDSTVDDDIFADEISFDMEDRSEVEYF